MRLWGLCLVFVLSAAGCGGSGGSGGTCSQEGEPCLEQSECCDGHICREYECLAYPDVQGCRGDGVICLDTDGCCSGLSCRRSDGACGRGGLLDPCRSSTDCADDLFCDSGWCTRKCDTVLDCEAEGMCVARGGEGVCAPRCDFFACDDWPGTECGSVTNVYGEKSDVCARK